MAQSIALLLLLSSLLFSSAVCGSDPPLGGAQDERATGKIIYDLETSTLSWDPEVFPSNPQYISKTPFSLTIADSSSGTVHVRTATWQTSYIFSKPHPCHLYRATVSVPGIDGELISVSREIGHQVPLTPSYADLSANQVAERNGTIFLRLPVNRSCTSQIPNVYAVHIDREEEPIITSAPYHYKNTIDVNTSIAGDVCCIYEFRISAGNEAGYSNIGEPLVLQSCLGRPESVRYMIAGIFMAVAGVITISCSVTVGLRLRQYRKSMLIQAEINLAQNNLPLDLRRAVELTKSVTHWFLLGVRLGVPYRQLKEIEQEHPRDVQSCRYNVLQAWLRGGCEVDAKVTELVKVVNSILKKEIFHDYRFFGPVSLYKAEKIAARVSNWKLLGKELGIASKKVKEVEMNYPGDIVWMKLEILQIWLNQSSHVEEQKLVQAVEKTLSSERYQRFSDAILNRTTAAVIFIMAILLYYSIYLAPAETVHVQESSNSLSIPTTPWFGNSESNTMHNLPAKPEPFIGRETDMSQVTSELLTGSSHIININGPPAYGKSTLAIHVGHEMFSRGTNVRYMDVNEHYLFLSNSFHSKVLEDNKAIQHYRAFTMSQYKESLNIPKEKVMINILAEELQEWARSITDPTILILDNCDDFLHSNDKRKFVYSIKGIIRLANYQLKVIITSQKHVWLLDDFFRWRVAELPLTAAAQLLRKVHPGLSANNDTVVRLVSAVGYCPLALKVIGSLLNGARVSLPNLLEDLEKNPIKTVSDGLEEGDRLEYILTVAYQYLTEDIRECGRYLCHFPGSFELTAGEAILEAINSTFLDDKCISMLIRHSLLDKFTYGSEETMLYIRIRMYKLIKEYFILHQNRPQTTLVRPLPFVKAFRNYYTRYIVNYTNASKYDEMKEYKFRSESHNFELLYQTLAMSADLSIAEVVSLCFALIREFLESAQFASIVYNALLDTTKYEAVCDALTSTECTKLYARILLALYDTRCKEETIDIANILWQTECRIFQCSHVAISLERFSADSVIYEVQSENMTLLRNRMALAARVCTMTRTIFYAFFLLIVLIFAAATVKTFVWKCFYFVWSVMTCYYTFYTVADVLRTTVTHEIIVFTAAIADYVLILLVSITTTLTAYTYGLLNSLYSTCMTVVLLLLTYYVFHSFSTVVLSTLILVYTLSPFVILFWLLTDFQCVMFLFMTAWVAAIFLPFVTYMYGTPILDV